MSKGRLNRHRKMNDKLARLAPAPSPRGRNTVPKQYAPNANRHLRRYLAWQLRQEAKGRKVKHGA